MSGKNPFRHPAHEDVVLAPPSPPLPPIPPEKPPARPPPSPAAGPSSSHAGPSDTEAILAAEPTEDELPPPYTPAANIGEETVGLGPRRPFQPPPPQPPSSLNPTPSRAQPNWPPPPQRYQPGPSSASGYAPPGLAPWQTQQQYRQRQRGGGGLIGALFDTVRDIAEVVSGAHDERMMVQRSANAGAYATPYTSTRTVYAPPPGQMPQPPPPPPRAASAPPQSPPPVPDDGSPTQTPVPGHPLLLHGDLLVYPRDHLCVKCKNTGYKNYDPSMPCRKCWDKYGRKYTGALTYTPWSPTQNDPRMQRPLPKFLPPHLAPSNAGPSPYAPQASYGLQPPSSQLQHSRSISQPHYRSPSGSEPSFYLLNPLSPCDRPPVPNAIPVAPGDPRLGGRMCMRCGGSGIRTVMLIDTTMCETCGGTGRVWR